MTAEVRGLEALSSTLGSVIEAELMGIKEGLLLASRVGANLWWGSIRV